MNVLLRVLVVEPVGGKLSAAAAACRCLVTTADNLERGFAVFRQICPDVVLIDLASFGAEGLALGARIRSLPNGDWPVLVSVADRYDPGLRSGDFDYLHVTDSTSTILSDFLRRYSETVAKVRWRRLIAPSAN